MRHRPLGRTGFTVSQLGFGAMRLPMRGEGAAQHVDRDRAVAMIHRAFEAGVNYIDTAVMYCNYESEAVVGEALKGWRDRVIVSTKNHYFGADESEWRRLLEQSLERLGVDRIDIYNHHGLNAKSFRELVQPTMSQWMIKARDEGLVKHTCCSFHDNNDALKEIIESGYPEVITLQYNLLDRQLEEGMALAHERGIGVVAMGPVAGGRLGEPSEILETLAPGVKRVPELALRFVLANSNVSSTISGMSTMEQVEENLATANDPVAWTDENRRDVEERLERLRRMADLYCTGCGYCQPCPAGVNIPGVFDHYNKGRVYGLWEHARKAYADLAAPDKEGNRGAGACTECGECETKCPQHIPIRKQLKEAHAALATPRE